MGMLADRVAVVTGAGRGIGRAIAELFVREGASVVVGDLDEPPAREAEAACNAIRAGAARAFVGSVARSEETDRLMQTAVDAFGKLDILVNNAGITADKMAHQMTDEAWDRVLDVNLKGTFYCIRSAAPHMREVAKRELTETGRVAYNRKVINFFSTAAIRGNPGQISYTAAKMGNVGITRTLAREWGRFGINVNAVAPGLTRTRLTAEKRPGDALGVPKEQFEEMVRQIPLGRAAEPEDVARVVLFFASPLSDFVTGQTLNVSGGMQIP